MKKIVSLFIMSVLVLLSTSAFCREYNVRDPYVISLKVDVNRSHVLRFKVFVDLPVGTEMIAYIAKDDFDVTKTGNYMRRTIRKIVGGYDHVGENCISLGHFETIPDGTYYFLLASTNHRPYSKYLSEWEKVFSNYGAGLFGNYVLETQYSNHVEKFFLYYKKFQKTGNKIRLLD